MALEPKHPSSAPPVLKAHKTVSVADRTNLEVGKALHDTVLEVALVEVDIVAVEYTTDYNLYWAAEVGARIGSGNSLG